MQTARAFALVALAATALPTLGLEDPRRTPRDAPAADRQGRDPRAKSGPEGVESAQKLRERLAERLNAVRPAQAPAEASRAARAAAPAASASAPKGHAPGTAHLPHWAYAGATGPQAWGGLRPEFAKCGNGSRQSPIDIRDGFAVDLEPVQFDYRATPFSVIDNGHTVQADLGSGNALQVGGRRYELVQFHFHRPSEERVAGRQFEMSAHLVHRDSEGRLAVVALLLDRGAPAPVVQQVWNNLPLEKLEPAPASAPVDLAQLLPQDRRYYTYMGSLTTPPCTEGVLWIVMQQPVTVSPEQIEIFSRLYPMNARPVQPSAGRMIKQSN